MLSVHQDHRAKTVAVEPKLGRRTLKASAPYMFDTYYCAILNGTERTCPSSFADFRLLTHFDVLMMSPSGESSMQLLFSHVVAASL